MARATRRHTTARRWLLATAALTCAAALVVPPAAAQEAPASDAVATEESPEAPSVSADDGSVSTTALPDTLALDGHGWGHGRGMGQYGSLGYATGITGSAWNHAQILDHFYGAAAGVTRAGHIEDRLMAVILKQRNNPYQALVAYRRTGLQVRGQSETSPAVRITLRGDGRYDLQTGTSCLGTWSTPTVVSGPVRVAKAPDSGTGALRLCYGGTEPYSVAYAHNTELVASGSETVNLVWREEMLRGIVPRESPASWGDAGGGTGMAALRAQAVAARSYASAGDDRWGDHHTALGAHATTCDDQFCQVYGGIAKISPPEADCTAQPSACTHLTHENTDRAIAETGNEVRITSSAGAVARTEFSSSTGGHTAGGAFPAVPDQGDAIASNPNHHWTGSLTRAAIEAKYGTGTLTDVRFERNGLGSMGGRVVKVWFVGTTRTVERTGNQVRQDFGLKSDWFDISVPPPPSIEPRSIDTACPSTIERDVFVDVSDQNGHARAIDCMAHHDIAQGTSDGRFSPTISVTRAQMASFVARLVEAADGTLPSSPPDAFDDDDGNTHEHRINQLAAAGIVRGTDTRTYEPHADIDRAQLASILARALEHVDVTLPADPAPAFDDDNGSVHEQRIDQLAEEGIVTGTQPATYQPRATAKRDQMASMLARALDLALSG